MLQEIKKKKTAKGKDIVITNPNNNSVCLLYLDNGEVKKAKTFIYPKTLSGKKKVDLLVNREFKLWLNVLWEYGYLEDDDFLLIEYKNKQNAKKNNKWKF